MRSARWCGVVSLALLLPPAAIFADDSSTASGTFASHGAHLPVVDAFAYRGTSSLGDDPVLVVAVSNRKFNGTTLGQYWDRHYVLEHLFKDDETGLVYFEFAPDGRYKGYSFYFGPGNGCGYCGGGEVKSTVKLAGGRLTGQLTQHGEKDEPEIDITLDAEITSDDHGAKQGAGGGEPGKAYLAYHRALGGSDPAAIRNLLTTERRETWNDAEKNGNGEGFLSWLRTDHPATVRVTEGFVQGDHALLLLEGSGESGKVRGEAQLSREQGAWRFEEEEIQPVSE